MFRRALFWLDLEILVFACVFMISWLATPTFFLSFFGIACFGYGTVHWNCGGKLVSGYGQLQSGSDILLYEIVTYTTIILALYISLPILFHFSLSVHRRLSFFLPSWYIFLASLGDCSYRDHGLLSVSVCLINLLPFFPCLANKVLFKLFFPSIFVFVFKLGLLEEGKENWTSNSLNLPLPNSFSLFRLRDVFKFWEREEFCFYESAFLGFCFDTHDP